MPDALKPENEKQVEDAVKWALAEGKTFEVVGRGSKRAYGRPSQSDLTLDLSALSGVTLYEPEELVLSARAGTPIAEIEALLDAKGQQLAFEPMDCGPLLTDPTDSNPAGGSIGGAIAAGLAGPRRIKAGSARDHFLGVSAVSGRGEIFKSGGRVVKNVTGYDLCKLMAGSFGTLAAMTEVTVKVLPKPETEDTLVLPDLDDARAIQAMSAAMASSADVSGAAYLPGHIAHRFSELGASQASALFRLEGFTPSVKHRKQSLATLLRPFGATSELGETRSRALWRSVRDARPFAANGPSGPRPVWRVSVAPSRGAEIATLINPSAQMFYDWAGGLIWIAPLPSGDAGAADVRKAVAAVGGHATLVRAPAAVRAAVDVFEPQPGPVAALTKRVKDSFDPKGMLNPGRMWAGV
jgi:glycolate oxidase FAD binding subunit